VSRGYFFFTRWDVPDNFDEIDDPPEAVGYVQSDGSMTEVPADPLRRRAWKWMRRRRAGEATDPDVTE
jgi:hypothetical protein